MNGLVSPRVAVIDDDRAEAMTLIEALGRKGVGAVYCTGQQGEFPPQPLPTLRLVFLDLYLTTGNINAVVRTTADALSRVADMTSPGLGIVLWTKHPKEEQDVFVQALKEQFPQFKPLFLMAQEKLLYLQQPELLDQLVADIEAKLAQSPGARLLLEWEQFVHAAVASSGNLLTSVAGNDDAIVDAAAALVQALGGPGTSEAETFARFFEAVNPILLDSIGAGGRGKAANADHTAKLHERSGTPLTLAPEKCSSINRILLTAAVQAGQTAVVQGNVYLNDGWDATSCCFPMHCEEKRVRTEFYSLFPCPANRDDPERKKKCEAWKQRLGTVAAKAIPCAVEISPACDIANGKTVFARLLGGFLIPEDGNQPKLLIPAEVRMYAKQLPSFHLADPTKKIDGHYSLVINARHLVTVAPDLLVKVQPLLRLRESVAIDIQAWFSGHAARPGFVAVY